jgi:hypothetical protein
LTENQIHPPLTRVRDPKSSAVDFTVFNHSHIFRLGAAFFEIPRHELEYQKRFCLADCRAMSFRPWWMAEFD